MNIKITHKWLLEYLDTDATPLEIQKFLSLCGPSVERIEEVGEETVYDIEITTNRIDTASVQGIAYEAAAILPQFGKKAVLKKKNLLLPEPPSTVVPIDIVDTDGVCKRILGIVMEVTKVSASPEYISKRLSAVGMRSLNNIVDVTNYVMTEIGHPTHVFDYDRIQTHKLILRYAKKGEEIITLDEKKYLLDSSDIVIDDGTGRIIDLPGIMGTANSVVTNDTKRILFFIESNDPISIRRTSMRYGIRTMASTINEKNPDPELGLTALLRGIQLFQEVSDAKPVSHIIDIYPKKAKPLQIRTSKDFIDMKVGSKIPFVTIKSILSHLGFEVKTSDENNMDITVPTFRINDVTIAEDIVEEVARVYGYFAIPSVLQPPAYVAQPKETELLFQYQHIIKTYLKHRGYTEVMNYSGISLELLTQFEGDANNYLHITNSISEDIKYLRRSLIPSLVKNVKQNEGFTQNLKIFELAKTYIPTNTLPDEENKLTICTTISLDELKAILIGLMRELNITFSFKKDDENIYLLPTVAGSLEQDSINFGTFGQVKPKYCRNLGYERSVFVAELSFEKLMFAARLMPDYKSFSQFAHITHDVTIKKTLPFSEIKKLGFSASTKLISLIPISSYKDTITVRLEFTDYARNITEVEVKKEVEKIQAALQ